MHELPNFIGALSDTNIILNSLLCRSVYNRMTRLLTAFSRETVKTCRVTTCWFRFNCTDQLSIRQVRCCHSGRSQRKQLHRYTCTCRVRIWSVLFGLRHCENMTQEDNAQITQRCPSLASVINSFVYFLTLVAWKIVSPTADVPNSMQQALMKSRYSHMSRRLVTTISSAQPHGCQKYCRFKFCSEKSWKLEYGTINDVIYDGWRQQWWSDDMICGEIDLLKFKLLKLLSKKLHLPLFEKSSVQTGVPWAAFFRKRQYH